MAGTENPQIESPIYIEGLHQHRPHLYTATNGDGVHRFPIRLQEIWNAYDDIPDVPDPTLLNDGDSDGVPNITLRKLRLLEAVPGTTTKFRLAAGAAGLVCATTATFGQTAPVAGNALPVLSVPPAPATGYTPVITDAAGGQHPMLAAEWILDCLTSFVVFPGGLPESPDGQALYPQPMRLTWFQYVGAFGGAGMGPGAHPWIEAADASATSLRRDPAFPISATADLVWPALTTEGGGRRMLFDESQAAFRAGATSGTQWDVASRGANSAAFGLDSIASGAGAAVSGGTANTASGPNAMAAGGAGNLAAGSVSWAGGGGSTAGHAGAFVWSDAAARASTAANEVTFGAAGGFRIFAGGAAGSLITLDGPVTMPGKLTVGGLIDPTGLVCVEQAAVPGGAPAAGDGTFWIRDDAPNVPIFTDDSGADRLLAYIDSVSLASAGGTETLVQDGTGPALATKGLTAGTGITLTGAAGDVTIAATSGGATSLTSAGGTETLVQDGTGPTLATKGLTAGTGIGLTGAANDVTVANTSPASSVTLASAGGTATLVVDGVGPSLSSKGLTAGTGVTLTPGANDVTISTSFSSIWKEVSSVISPVTASELSVIVGGVTQTLASGATSSAIIGGEQNAISSVVADSVISAGDTSIIGGPGSKFACFVVGNTNGITGTQAGHNLAVVGGNNNTIDTTLGGVTAATSDDVILGGQGNSIGARSDRSVILGGVNNFYNGFPHNNCAIIAGNTCAFSANNGGANQCIISGADNTIIGSRIGHNLLVLGGKNHTMDTTSGPTLTLVDASILGGDNHFMNINADRTVIIGGSNGTSGHSDSFLFTSGAALATAANSSFTAKAAGGFRMFTNDAATTGVQLPANLSAWAAVSDRNKKNLQKVLDGADVLERLRHVDIFEFNYRGQPENLKYRGPVAQEWHEQFPSGKDPLLIDTIDPAGIALCAVKGLDVRARGEYASLRAEIASLRAELAGLRI